MQVGPAEILVVLVIALLVFGPAKLPEVGRQVGRAMKEFRQFQQTMSRDISEVFADDGLASAEPVPTLPAKPETIDAHAAKVTSESGVDVASGVATEVSKDIALSPSPGESTGGPEASA